MIKTIDIFCCRCIINHVKVDKDLSAIIKDSEIIEKIKSGDIVAEEEFLVEKRQLVLSCIRTYFLYGGDTEDLFQEGMIGLLAAVRKFDTSLGVPFDAFASRCIKAQVISAVRKACNSGQSLLNSCLSLDSILDGSVTASFESDIQSDDPEDIIIDKVFRQNLIKAFTKQLSTLENRVLELFLDGHSYADIADKLGKSIKTVYNTVDRIKEKLAQLIESGDFSLS